MMNNRESDTQHISRTNGGEKIMKPSGSSLVTLSLFLSAVVMFIPQLITSLLLIEISQSFGIEVGLARAYDNHFRLSHRIDVCSSKYTRA